MQYAPVRLADLPVSGVMCGIDWARDDHAVAIIDRDAQVRYRGVAEHSARGLKDLIAVLARHGVAEVAIERADGPLVEALLAAGLTVGACLIDCVRGWAWMVVLVTTGQE